MADTLKEILFDEENKENIVLLDDKGKEIEFEQIAVIPIEEKLYVILKPVDAKAVEIEEDEAFAMRVEEDDAGNTTVMLADEDEADKVFEIYEELLANATEE